MTLKEYKEKRMKDSDFKKTYDGMGETNAYHFSLSENQSFPGLSKEEKDILDEVIEKLGKMSKNEIINFMHKEQAYIETAPRDIIQFKYAENLQI